MRGIDLDEQKRINYYMSASNEGVKKGQAEFLNIKESILDYYKKVAVSPVARCGKF